MLSQALRLVAGNVSNSEPYRYVATVRVTVRSQKRAPASSIHIELKTRHLGGVESDDHGGRIDNGFERDRIMRCGKHQPRGRTENAVQHPSATDRNERRTGDYSFPGSSWERIGVEAPASRVHKLRMHFGEANALLLFFLGYQVFHDAFWNFFAQMLGLFGFVGV